MRPPNFPRSMLCTSRISVWGEGTCGHNTGAVFNLRSFGRYGRAPLVLTLHDVTSLRSFGCRNLRVNSENTPPGLLSGQISTDHSARVGHTQQKRDQELGE